MMPVVSEAQRRAMEAAKHGKSTLGIPKKVAAEFLAKDAAGVKGHAAGTIHVAPDGSILLLHRSPTEENYAGHWALPGGKAEDGESPDEAADREVKEETGYSSGIPKRLLDQRITPNGMAFHTFVKPVFEKFAPKLNDEHSGFTWAGLDMLPQPLHPAVAKTIEEKSGKDGKKLQKWATEPEKDEAEDEDIAQDGVHAACGGRGCDGCGGSGISPTNNWPMKPGLGAMDGLAFDRAPDGLEIVRRGIVATLAFDRDTKQGQTTDDFERMHVKRAPITKAGVNPYYGREIPKGQELGLDPSKVYKLFRDPEEIKKGAATSHNVPLLSEHVPHSADEHDGDITVGTVGSESEFEHPYLYNSLAVWNRDGLDLVDSGEKKELSSAYSYDADMTPGTFEGQSYDGVMRNMKWNHVCLVKKGRAGSDVALDEALQHQQEIFTMSTKLKSLKAGVAYGAITNLLRGVKLAQDAAIDLGPAFAGVRSGKFGAAKKKIVAGVKSALKGKLAQDGDLVGIIEGVEKLMNSIDGDKMVEDGDVEDEGDDTDDDESAMDGGMEAVKAYLKSKGVGDDIIAGMPSGESEAEDSEMTPEEMEAKKKKEAEDAVTVETEDGPDGKGAKDKKPEFMSKGAMDAALEKHGKDIEQRTIKRMQGVTKALAHVEPITGKLEMAFDSAEGVYRKAFKMQDRDVSKIRELDALVAMWDMVPVPGQTRQRVIAQDSVSESGDDFAKAFPNMAKVRRA